VNYFEFTPSIHGFSYRDLRGEDRWNEFTVSTNISSSGTLTANGRLRVVGKLCQFQVELSAGTSITSEAGASYIALPLAAKGLAGMGAMVNDSSSVSVGLCSIQVSTSRCYLPTQSASANTFKVYGEYEIGGQ
jgi:hypothetical protein